MDEPIVEGNCGELCGYHCCRSHEGKENLGMYLIPFEFESIQSNMDIDYEVHTAYNYELPKPLKRQHYIFCSNNSGCLRKLRPIQCRTYPLEAHIENGEFQLIIEKNQLHACPLISQRDLWRNEFLEGVYKAWTLLLEDETIKAYIESISQKRLEEDNILVVVK